MMPTELTLGAKWELARASKVCVNCNGNGRIEMLEHCLPCKGAGHIFPLWEPLTLTCSSCLGFGRIEKMGAEWFGRHNGIKECSRCHGLGRKPIENDGEFCWKLHEWFRANEYTVRSGRTWWEIRPPTLSIKAFMLGARTFEKAAKAALQADDNMKRRSKWQS